MQEFNFNTPKMVTSAVEHKYILYNLGFIFTNMFYKKIKWTLIKALIIEFQLLKWALCRC